MSFLRDVRKDLSAHKSKYRQEDDYNLFSGSIFLGLINPCFALVFTYRIYSRLFRSKNKVLKILGTFMYYRACRKYSCDIHPRCNIGVPMKVGHCSDIVIGPLATVGNNAYFFNGVSIGNKHVGDADDMPELGDNVIIGTGSKILGPTKVGSNVKIGALTLVSSDVPDDSTVVGIPGRLI